MDMMQMTVPPELLPVGRLELSFDRPLVYETHAGARGFLKAATGSLKGPRIDARLADDGGEWLVFRPDGLIETDARLMLATADGGHVYLRSRGLVQATPEAVAAFREAGGTPADHAFRCSPWFEAQPGPHDWLSRAVFLGVGALSWRGLAIDIFEVA